MPLCFRSVFISFGSRCFTFTLNRLPVFPSLLLCVCCTLLSHYNLISVIMQNNNTNPYSLFAICLNHYTVLWLILVRIFSHGDGSRHIPLPWLLNPETHGDICWMCSEAVRTDVQTDWGAPLCASGQSVIWPLGAVTNSQLTHIYFMRNLRPDVCVIV